MDPRRSYTRDGFYIAEGLFSHDEAMAIKQAVQRDTGAIDASGVKVFDGPATPPAMLDVCRDDRIVGILKQILGGDVAFLSVKPVVKSPRFAAASPWHQDWVYWHGSHKLSAWIALDEARVDNGCLRIVAGSHVDQWDHDSVASQEGFGNRISDEAIVDRYGESAIRDVPLPAGSVLLFHDLLLHASHPNTSGGDRWSLIPTYRDDSVADDHDSPTLWREPIRL